MSKKKPKKAEPRKADTATTRPEPARAETLKPEPAKGDGIVKIDGRPKGKLVEPSLDALKPALAKQMPVAFDANEGREIDRSLLMARDFGLDPIIVLTLDSTAEICD